MENGHSEHVLQTKKRAQAQHILTQLNIPAWVIITADNEAENAHLPLIGAPFGSTNRAYVLTPDRAVAISPIIESAKQEAAGFETITAAGKNVIPPLAANLADIVGDKNTPFALNYSTRFPAVDTLGHGTWLQLASELKKAQYFSGDPGELFLSADDLIFTVASTKLPFEIERLREAAQITEKVLVEAFGLLKAGLTEKEVAAIVHTVANKRMAQDKRIGYSWQPEYNPVVLTGERIAGSPHEAPSDAQLKPGNTVYIDFGLSVDGYCGDLQHFGYVLCQQETEAPVAVQEAYRLLRTSIEAGMAAARPGTLGWQVDKASRDVIVNAGHPTYKHGTGHQLGVGGAHAPGVAFYSKYEDFSNDDPALQQAAAAEPPAIHLASQLPIKEGYVLTIEPRIQIENGASIEVDGLVTEQGFSLFAPIQEDIHLIS